jgi:hypothetical protein
MMRTRKNSSLDLAAQEHDRLSPATMQNPQTQMSGPGCACQRTKSRHEKTKPRSWCVNRKATRGRNLMRENSELGLKTLAAETIQAAGNKTEDLSGKNKLHKGTGSQI